MKKNVLLLEINEITWDLIDPLIESGELPTFAKLKRESAWASPMSVDLPPQLDPWVTWTTVYTGRPQNEHNVFHLQQPPETIKAKRIWEICKEAGLKVGVFGSIGAYPPQQVDGFYVPESFAPDTATFPAKLSPIQKLNLTYTRSIRLENDDDGIAFKAKLGKDLLSLGLRGSTCTKIVKQLATEQVKPKKRWQRVVLQPAVNFDFFSRLHAKNKPNFASFHTNHVAHFQHTYWKAMQPELFPQPTTREERETYGDAIKFGYRSADELLRRAVDLCDENTILVVASSMGQKPFVLENEKGKQIGQLRSLDNLVETIGLAGQIRTLSTMSDQFNIYGETEGVIERAKEILAGSYIDTPDKPMFYLSEMDDFITVNLTHYDDVHENSTVYLNGRTFRYEDLVYQTGLSKSGCHDPKGMMMIYGRGIKRGFEIADVNNLDIAPTLLSILGLPVPPEMTGRVLSEAFEER